MIDKDTKSLILEEFDQRHGTYSELATTVKLLLEQVVRQESLQVHSITSRCKNRDSLERKLGGPDKSYKKLADLTDIAGIRITTYFAEDVDRIAKIVEREFSIDREASVDRRTPADPDRFGYQSLHHIAQLSVARSVLPEYLRLAGLRFEIQVRSILQHAWAEIEHDLGYKSALGVPANIRRRFARIAGLLELADSEFSSIRSELKAYEVALPARITRVPNEVTVDLPSLRSLYQSESRVAKLDRVVVDTAGASLSLTDERLEHFVPRLHHIGLSTISQLEEAAAENVDLVKAFTKYWVGDEELGELDVGIGLFYLLYVLLWKTQDEKMVYEYFSKNKIGDDLEYGENVKRVLAFAPVRH